MNPSRNTVVLSATRLTHLLLICVASMFLVTGAHGLRAAQSEQRKLKEIKFADMPVRVREVRNLQTDTWPKDLQIEIENVSSKPIYFINAVLEFPDDPAPNGTSGIILTYGNPDNMDIARIAKAEDEHIEPGKNIFLVISDVYRKGLSAKQKNQPENLKKLDLWFEIISFGDATGFEVSQFLDLRKRR